MQEAQLACFRLLPTGDVALEPHPEGPSHHHSVWVSVTAVLIVTVLTVTADLTETVSTVCRAGGSTLAGARRDRLAHHLRPRPRPVCNCLESMQVYETVLTV